MPNSLERYKLSLFILLMLLQLCFSQNWCWQKQLQSIIPLFTLNKTLPILSELPTFWVGGNKTCNIGLALSFHELLLPWYLQINIEKCSFFFLQNSYVRLFIPRKMIDLLTALSIRYRTYILHLKVWKMQKVKVDVRSTLDIFCISNKLLCIKILLF